MRQLSRRMTVGLIGFVCTCGGSGTPPATRDAAAAENSPRAAAPDPCTLLTQAEAEEIMGRKLGPPTMQPGGGCWFGRSLALSFLPVSPRSPAEFEAFIKEEGENFNAKMRKAGAKESTIDRVSQLGAPAFYVDPSLFVYRNKQVLAIFADRGQAIAAAAKAMTRWK